MMDYPVKDKFLARQVTELDFEIAPENEAALYVDLDSVRPADCFKDIKFVLNIDEENGQLVRLTDSYAKIIFSGHRGCGKSTELHRFQKDVNHPGRYCSIFIDMEKEVEITTFEPEDLFVTLIFKLVERLHDEGLSIETAQLGDLIKEWLSETEIQNELKTSYNLDISSEVSASAGFLGFLKLKGSLKALFSSSSNTVKRIREKVRKNPHNLVNRINLALEDARKVLESAGKGKDILFVIDGFEKMRYEIFQQLFIKESSMLQALNSSILFTVPINSYYNISDSASSEFFQNHLLPMVPVNTDSKPLLAEIIEKRIDRSVFFTKGALDKAVDMSGGCPRQLLRIVNRVIVQRRGEKMTPKDVEQACIYLGQEMWDKLDSEHRKILQEKTYQAADRKSLDLLFSLAVLKYNGTRGINPLLSSFVGGGEAAVK
ncbi:MAG: hypothetical protein WC799_03290 [Desulfobacteraceae bacterium]|jgi:hypothetical protein